MIGKFGSAWLSWPASIVAGIIGILALGGSAEAKKRASIQVPSTSIALGDATISAAVRSVGGIGFPDTDPGYVDLEFVLPADYRPKSKVVVVFSFTNPAAGPCSAKFLFQSTVRSRAHRQLDLSSDVAAAKGGQIVSFSDVFTARRKTYVLKRGVLGQKPGDRIWLRYGRDPAVAGDTCGVVVMLGAEIRYVVKAKAGD